MPVFNLFMYEAYIADVTKTVQYIVDHYEVKIWFKFRRVNAISTTKMQICSLTSVCGRKVHHYGSFTAIFIRQSQLWVRKSGFRRDGICRKHLMFSRWQQVYDKSLRDRTNSDLTATRKISCVFKLPKYEYKLHHIDDFIHSVAAIKTL